MGMGRDTKGPASRQALFLRLSTRVAVAAIILCPRGVGLVGELAMWQVCVAMIGAISISLGSCARPTNITLVPTGGSRADGTVTLSYEYGGLEKPGAESSSGIGGRS
jgi:hypothetical protein